MAQDIFTSIFKIFTLLIIFASVLFLAYVSTKYIGQKASMAMRGKFVRIVETLNLGVDKRIYLIKAGNKFFLMASSGKNLQFLTEVEIEDTDNAADNTDENAGESNVQGAYRIPPMKNEFKNVLDKYIHLNKKAVPDIKNKRQKNEEYKDDSNKAGDGIKENLNKLKNMTKKVKQEDNNETTTEK